MNVLLRTTENFKPPLLVLKFPKTLPIYFQASEEAWYRAVFVNIAPCHTTVKDLPTVIGVSLEVTGDVMPVSSRLEGQKEYDRHQ